MNSSGENAALSATSLIGILRLLPGVVFRQHANLGFSFASSRIEGITGLSAAEWLTQPPRRFWEVVHEADAGQLQKQLERAAQSNEVVTSIYRVRHLLSKQITCVQEQRQMRQSGDGSWLGYDGIWLDVTQQIIAEKLHSSPTWTNTLARLGDVLLHDFNNRMTGIHALSESFRSQLGSDHPYHEGLELMQRNAIQAKEIVQRIVALNDRRPGKRSFHNLNDLVDDGLELLRKIVPRRIQIKTVLAPESLPVYTDAAELREVMIELASNAVNAMPQNGTLRFETSRQTEFPTQPYQRGTISRMPVICLVVANTGGGNPARLLPEMFDPFSTTQPLNEVSGLELHRIAQLVEKHHGAISVEWVEGTGTTFRVWLLEADFTESDGDRTHVP